MTKYRLAVEANILSRFQYKHDIDVFCCPEIRPALIHDNRTGCAADNKKTVLVSTEPLF